MARAESDRESRVQAAANRRGLWIEEKRTYILAGSTVEVDTIVASPEQWEESEESRDEGWDFIRHPEGIVIAQKILG